MTFYLYTDEHGLETLQNASQKIILIGGDSGYGNFGDILQHINAINITQKSKRFTCISILRSNAISSADFPYWARENYGTDVVIFLADYPLILGKNDPKLLPVETIRNIAGIYLYGGGFLNPLWGPAMLDICEYFLRLAPKASYLASGQQITAPYQEDVVKHIATFKPQLFGVRDLVSQQHLTEAGYASEFSFDDATEALIALSDCAPLTQGPGIILHLNSSDYTDNDLNLSGVAGDLNLLRASPHGEETVTLFQAFRDIRHNVYDSRETIKQLDFAFPFPDIRLIETAGLIFKGNTSILTKPITATIGYSCSYHITLWLQLNDIPCWLKSANSYYNQKSRALQIQQSLPEFLHEPQRTDHRINLERRKHWLDRFFAELNNIPEVDSYSTISGSLNGPAPWTFFYKGKPTHTNQLHDMESNYTNQLHDMESNHTNQTQELSHRISALTAQITSIGNGYHEQNKHIKNLEGELATRNSELQISRHEVALALAQMNSILHSRSWRSTKILRVLGQTARRWREIFCTILHVPSKRS